MAVISYDEYKERVRLAEQARAKEPAQELPEHRFAEYYQAQVDEQRHERDNSFLNQAKNSNFIKNYTQTKEDVLLEAKKISLATKIPENALLTNRESLEKGREIFQTLQELEALRSDGLNDINYEELYKSYPGLREIHANSDADAAIVLKNIKDIDKIYGTLDNLGEVFSGSWNLAYVEGEQAVRYAIDRYGLGGEENKARLAELDEEIEKLPRLQEGIWNNNIVARIVGDTTAQAPRLAAGSGVGLGLASVVVGASTIQGAVAGGVVGAAAGGVGAIPGALAGATIGFARGLPWATKAYQAGLYISMALESTGRYTKEYDEDTDAQGRKLYRADQALIYGTVQGNIEAAIGLLPLKQIGRAVFGNLPFTAGIQNFAKGLLSKNTAVGISTIVKTSPTVQAAKGGSKAFMYNQIKTSAKVAGYEITEEMTQEAASMIVENLFLSIAKRQGFDVDTHSLTDIISETFEAGVMAVPASVGFGIVGFGVGAPNNLYRSAKLQRTAASMQKGELLNIQGHAQLDALKANEQEIKELRGKAPDVQRKILQAKLDETGNSVWKVDTTALLQEKNGLEILQAMAEAQGLSPEEAQSVIYNKSNFEIDSAAYAMYINTSKYDDVARRHITTDENVTTIAQAEEAKAVADRFREIIEQQAQLESNQISRHVERLFPEEGPQKDLAVQAILTNPQNPADGWKAMREGTMAEFDAALLPYYSYIEEATGESTEQGNYDKPAFYEANLSNSWYDDFRKKNDRPPTIEERRQIAYDMALGNIANPVNYNGGAEFFESQDAVLTPLKDRLEALYAIKDKMNTLTASEIGIAKQLTDEGFKVYQAVYEKLLAISDKNDSPAVKRSARMGAILFARHADIYAQVMKEAGKAEYTALDYLQKVGIETGNVYADTVSVSFDQASKLSPAQNIREFIFEIEGLKGDKQLISKTRFEFNTDKGATLTILGSDFNHIQSGKHSLTVEQWEALLANMENIEYVVGDNVRGQRSGRPVHVKINTPLGKAGVLLEFIGNGRIMFSTAIFSNDAAIDNWAKNKKTPYTLGIDAETAQNRIAGSPSVYSSIQEKLGIVNAYKQGNRGFIEIRSNGERVINLLSTANQSTFLHESGHLFLEDLRELAAIANAPQWVVDDWATIKKDLKFKDKQTNFTAKQQERFANQFTNYLQSGKAPTKSLRTVFRRFKKWLTDVYDKFMAAAGNPSPQVEAVMSRMIASIEEINTELELQGINEFNKAKGLDGLRNSSKEMYRNWQEELQESAQEKLLAYALVDLKNRDPANRQEQINQAREEFIEQQENSKIWQDYQLWQDGGKTNAILNTLGYANREMFDAALQEAGGSPQQALDKYMRAYEDNLANPPVENAAMTERAKELIASNEYADLKVAFEHETLRQRLQSTEQLKASEDVKKIQDRADKQLQKTQDAREAADTALKRTKASLHIFQGNVSALARIANEVATEQSQQLPIEQSTNFAMWNKKAEQYARLANRALARQDINAAFDAKAQELANRALAKAAVRNKQIVGRKTKQVRTMARIIGKRKAFPVTERYYYSALMYRLGLLRKPPPVPMTQIPSFDGMFAQYSENGETIGGAPEWVSQALTNSDLNIAVKKLNLDQFEDLVDTMRLIYTQGRDVNRLKTDQTVSFTDLRDRLVEHGYTATKRMVQHDMLARDSGQLGGVANSYLSQILRPETIMRLLDGGDNGPIHRELYNRVADATGEQLKEQLHGGKVINDLWSAYTHKERYDMAREKLYNLPGNQSQLTKENLLCILFNWGNPINRKRVTSGFNVTEQDVLTLFKNLDARDVQLANGVWSHINSYWERIVKTEELMTGVTPVKVEAVPFEFEGKDGRTLTADGGYYPISYNIAKSKRASDFSQNQLAKQHMTYNSTLGTRVGHTKGKTQANIQGRPLLLSFSIINNHLADVIDNTTIRAAVRDVNKIINDEQFANMVKDKTGDNTYRVLQQWAKDLWAMDRPNNNDAQVESIVKKFRINANIAIMGYRLSTALLNAAQIAPMALHMGAANALTAVSEFYSDFRNNYDFIMENSVILQDRINTADPSLRELNQRLKPGRFELVDKAKRNAYALLTWSDLSLSMPAWNKLYKDTYNAELAAGNTDMEAIHKKAVREGDKIVREAFGGGLTQDLAQIQKGGEITKTFIPFYSFFNMQINVFLESWFQARDSGNYSKVYRTVMYNFLLMSAIETLVLQLAKDDDDERDAAYFAKAYARNLIGNSTGGLVGIRDVINFTSAVAFDGRSIGGGAPTALALQALDRADALTNTARAVFNDSGKKSFVDLGQDATRVATVIAGFPDAPAGAIWNTMRWFDSDFEDDTVSYLRSILFDKRLKRKKKGATKK